MAQEKIKSLINQKSKKKQQDKIYPSISFPEQKAHNSLNP